MAGALGWLGYRFIYTALAANAEYRAGYQRISEARYPEAERSFEKASAMKEYVSWYYRYAEAYVAKRQYLRAERKYAALVDRYPKETRAILEWAKLEKDQLKFEDAVKVLKGTERKPGDETTRGMSGLLSWDYFNKDGLLLLGDIYLDWAEEDPKHYEDARLQYARLIERFGQIDLYMGRMLLYFIRTDNLKEVKPLVARYVTGRTVADAATIPLDAQTLAELGGYLLDKGMIEDVRLRPHRGGDQGPLPARGPLPPDPLLPAGRRPGRGAEGPRQRDQDLRAPARPSARGARGCTSTASSGAGRFRVAGGEWMSAEQDYSKAADEYERGVSLKRLKRGPRFAEAYAGLAEVAYWQREDLVAALGLYERAAADGYDPPDARYKRAYILYRQGRTADSLVQFYRAGLEGKASPYLDYAFGDALFARGDYFAAEGYYRRVVEAMNQELAEIDMPSPQERPSQGEIVELLNEGPEQPRRLDLQGIGPDRRSPAPQRRDDRLLGIHPPLRLPDPRPGHPRPHGVEEPRLPQHGLHPPPPARHGRRGLHRDTAGDAVPEEEVGDSRRVRDLSQRGPPQESARDELRVVGVVRESWLR